METKCFIELCSLFLAAGIAFQRLDEGEAERAQLAVAVADVAYVHAALVLEGDGYDFRVGQLKVMHAAAHGVAVDADE